MDPSIKSPYQSPYLEEDQDEDHEEAEHHEYCSPGQPATDSISNSPPPIEQESPKLNFILTLDDLYHDNTIYPPSLSSAERLYQSVIWDFIPTDLQVLAEFGFDELDTIREKSNLVRLYQGLRYFRITPDELQKWQVEGSLVDNIIQTYCRVPEINRGFYFEWFLGRTWVLEKAEEELSEIC
ncbi:hypothetical protein N7520_010417 [Penicillium odoratum]|uniref:uncharacterized protein n=1 Tax=Penicillium odoratum TaxID=1167516 RepID=UPI002546E065|nr:uncharacterized protein N7520_010417 [Penicillium odoratum]KAJ5745235.1 hypothetical protein N7520_010417 [Penicillium odoratum]